MNDDLDARISAALHAAVDGLREQDLRPGAPPVGQRSRRQHIRWIAPLLTAAAVATAIITTVALTSSPSASPTHQPGGGPPLPTAEPSQPTSLPPPSPTTSVPPVYSTTVSARPSVGDVPLWPFGSPAQALRWENVDGPNGHSPWHADAKATALFFVTGYLQFNDITEVTSADIRSTVAIIGVGFGLPGGDKHTASLLRLVRYGDDTGPWEVVSATAQDFSIDSPKYGEIVTSPVTVTGRITGVDASLTVAVRSIDGMVDVSDPIPAGGDNAAWTTIVPYSDRQHGVLTIVASVGGGLAAHGTFAVTGVNASS
jgi:hypothetical protein